MTQEEIIDLLTDAINDNFEQDWTARDGARAIFNALYAEGLLPLMADDQARIDAAWEAHKAAAPHCEVPPEGWFCTRPTNHPGPCAAYPVSHKCEQSPFSIHVVDTSMESGPRNCFHCGRAMP